MPSDFWIPFNSKLFSPPLPVVFLVAEKAPPDVLAAWFWPSKIIFELSSKELIMNVPSRSLNIELPPRVLSRTTLTVLFLGIFTVSLTDTS